MTVTDTHSDPPSGLRGELNRRQMNMIAVGGVIGAGLFVGSGSAIGQAGPAIVVVYSAVGILVVLIMQMLAELAVASPESGSFSSYARREIGPWAGLSTGWLYAYTWIVIIGFEATAGAGLLHGLAPSIPAWLAALVFMTILTATNLASVKSFGELEFWFAAIKVTVIIGFLLIGAAAILGLVPNVPAPGMSNLTGHGGFAPFGWTQVALASLVVIFSYFGTEVVTIAAGEARDPRRAVRAALRTVVIRIFIFYVGSIAIIVTLLPSTSTSVTESPFVATLNHLGIGGAATIMNIVVITAVLSCLNSGIYSCSRIIYATAQRGEGPRALGKVNHRGVPVAGVYLASVGGFITVIANYFLPTATLFNFLLNSTGAMALVIYFVIAFSQLRGRKRAIVEGRELPVKMWAYPYLTWFVIGILLFISTALAINGPTRKSFLLTAVVTAIAVTAGLIYQRRMESSPNASTLDQKDISATGN